MRKELMKVAAVLIIAALGITALGGDTEQWHEVRTMRVYAQGEGKTLLVDGNDQIYELKTEKLDKYETYLVEVDTMGTSDLSDDRLLSIRVRD